MWNLIFLYTGLLFSVLLIVVFKTKAHITSKENKMFSILTIFNFFGYITELFLQYSISLLGPNASTSLILGKAYIIYLFVWFGIFSIYAFYISQKTNNDKTYSLIKKLHILLMVVGSIIMIVLPISIYYENGAMYSYGASTNALKVALGVYIFAWVIRLLLNLKMIVNKKFTPIFVAIFCLLLNMIIQIINPTVLIATFTMTLICYLMYFTIENPDMKMLNALKTNRDLVDKTFEEKSNLLFNITQEVKNPLNEIIETCNDLNGDENTEELQLGLANVKKYASQLGFVVNNLLNISDLNSNNMKHNNHKYNIKSLLRQLELKAKPLVKESIRFDYVISPSIPDELYGDDDKLKQVLTTIILDAVDYTTEGFIEIRSEAITKYDACRLIFTIENSGKEIPIDKINEYLSPSKELSEDELKKLDEVNITIPLANKVLRSIGGNMLIKSNEKGTKFIIILEQKIAKQNDGELEKNKYNDIHQVKKVLVVSDDEDDLKIIKDTFKDELIDVSISLSSNDVLTRLKEKEKIDLIITEDEMKFENGYEVNKKVKENEYKVPVVIILDKNKESIKHKYLNDFDDYLLKSQFKDDLQNIIKKYL